MTAFVERYRPSRFLVTCRVLSYQQPAAPDAPTCGSRGYLFRAGDEGIDGIINEDRLGLDVIYIQAKRWEGTVGRPDCGACPIACC